MFNTIYDKATIENIRSRLLILMREKHLSYRQVCQATGICRKTLYNFFKGRPTWDRTISKIFSFLKDNRNQ